VGKFLVGPAFLVDESLPHRFGRDPSVQERRLKLRIRLAFGIRQRADVSFQLRQFLFRLVIAPGGKIPQASDPCSQFVQAQRHSVVRPAEDPFRLPHAPVQVIQCHQVTDQRPDVVQRMKNITAAGTSRQSLLVPGAEPRGEIGDGGLGSEAPVDQFQQPDAPGIGFAMLFRTQQEAEGSSRLEGHETPTSIGAGEIGPVIEGKSHCETETCEVA
jgi:hypothetical protein